MDDNRFDSLTRRLGAPASRRAALGAGLAGGVLGALRIPRSVPEVGAAQAGTCSLPFVANVRVGPSAEIPLLQENAPPGELRGELRFTLSDQGRFQNAELRLPDGTSFPVVGQATGMRSKRGSSLRRATRWSSRESASGRSPIARARSMVWPPVPRSAISVTGTRQRRRARQHRVERVKAGRPRAPVAPPQHRHRGGPGERPRRPRPILPDPRLAPHPPTGETPLACVLTETNCGGVCVNLSSDANNCGECGNACATDQVCQGGVCSAPPLACVLTETNCNGVCVDLSSDAENCGACGNVCTPDQLCQGGVCSAPPIACVLTETNCGGVCVNLMTDPANCGACGNACGIDQVCDGGVCSAQLLACMLTETNCGGVCVNLSSDPSNCGACGSVCAPDQVCEGGVCSALPQACLGTGDVCVDPTVCCSGLCNPDGFCA